MRPQLGRHQRVDGVLHGTAAAGAIDRVSVKLASDGFVLRDVHQPELVRRVRGEEDGDGHATILPPVEGPGGEESPDRSTIMVVIVGPGIVAGPRVVHCGDGGPS